MTAGIFGTGISGLMANRRGLATTGHNIANVNTEGYTRQRVELGTRPPMGYGNGFIGSGVDVTSVQRVIDGFTTTQIRTSTSAFGEVDTFVLFFLTDANTQDHLDDKPGDQTGDEGPAQNHAEAGQLRTDGRLLVGEHDLAFLDLGDAQPHDVLPEDRNNRSHQDLDVCPERPLVDIEVVVLHPLGD